MAYKAGSVFQILVPCICVWLGGCISTTSYTDTGKGGQGGYTLLPEVAFRLNDDYHQHPPECIAILPLNKTKTKSKEMDISLDEAETVRRALYAHLSPQGKRDVEIPRIDFLLEEMRAPDRGNYIRVGEKLGCDALIVGDVTEYGTMFLGLYSKIAVGANLKMIRAETGKVLWQGSHVAKSHGGSIPLSPIGIATGILDAAMNLEEEQLLRVVDDLARRLVSTIPDNRIAVLDEPEKPSAQKRPEETADASGVEGFLKQNRQRPLEEQGASLKEAIKKSTFHGRDAEILHKELMTIAPDDREGFSLYARHLVEKGDYYTALGYAEKSLAINAKVAETHFLKSRILIKLNDLAGADGAVLQAIALDRTNDGYFNALGFINSLSGRHERALAAYQMALDLNQDNGFALYNIGVTMNNVDELVLARDYFFKAGQAYLKRGDYGQVVKVIADLKNFASKGVESTFQVRELEDALSQLSVGLKSGGRENV